jgi:hypothetical protein
MTGFGAAASAAAAAERCALAIRARPAASSPAKRQQQSASLRRSGGGQRRPTTLAASRRGPVVPRAVATSADRASPDVSTSCLLYVSPLGHHQLMRYHCLAICLLHFPFFPFYRSLSESSRWIPTPSSRCHRGIPGSFTICYDFYLYNTIGALCGNRLQ